MVAQRLLVGALATATLALCLVLAPARRAAAYGGYAPGSAGRALLYTQCGADFPAPPKTFAIISITAGRAFYQNPCLVSEYSWATAGASPPSYVLNLNAPVGTTAFKAQSGPKGTCRASDSACLSYNYGYNAAASAYADAQSQHAYASRWWLDVETTNSWSDDTKANAQVVQGAIDYLQSEGVVVGLYSSPGQWQQIAGSYAPKLPLWVAGAADAESAPRYCSADHAFGGGTVWLVQYPTAGGGIGAYACGTSAKRAPTVPQNVKATALDALSIQVMWTVDPDTTDAVGVYSEDGLVTTLAGPATGYTISGLQPGQRLCVNLLAINAAGYSDWAGWVCATTPGGS
jgi:hypothetical protein